MSERASRHAWIASDNLTSVIWRLALPMVVQQLFMDLLTMVDMFWVSRIEGAEVAVAAVTTAATIQNIMMMVGIGITSGTLAMVAHSHGAGDRERGVKAVSQSIIMALFFGAVIAVVGGTTAVRMFSALNASPEQISAGKWYLRILMIGSAGLFLNVVFMASVRATGDAITPLVVMAIANVLNLILDPLLIFGLRIRGAQILPEMGVAGSGLATVLVQFLAAGIMAWIFFIRGHEHFRLRLRDLTPDLKLMLRILRIGVFGAGQMLIMNVSALLLRRLVNDFGDEPGAAYGLGLRITMAAMIPGMGFGMAAATIVGQNLGAGKPERAEKAGWMVAGAYGAFALAMTAIFVIFAPAIAGFYGKKMSPHVVEMTVNVLRWLAAPFVFVAFGMVLNRAMSGAGDTFSPMLVAAIALLGVRIPLAHLLAHVLGDAAGVWISVAASFVLQGALSIGIYHWGRWKRVGLALGGGH